MGIRVIRPFSPILCIKKKCQRIVLVICESNMGQSHRPSEVKEYTKIRNDEQERKENKAEEQQQKIVQSKTVMHTIR